MIRLIIVVISILSLIFTPYAFAAGPFYVCEDAATCQGGAAGNGDWVSGNDNNGGLSRGDALATPQAAVLKLTDGGAEIVYIGKGIYEEYVAYNYIIQLYNISGQDASNPHTIRAETIYNGITGTPEVIFDGQRTCRYGVLLSDGGTGAVQYFKFQGIQFFETDNGIWANSLSTSQVYTDITIDQCEFSNMYRWATKAGDVGIGMGVFAQAWTRDFTIMSSYFHDNGRTPGGNNGDIHDFVHDQHLYMNGSGHEVYNSVFTNAYSGWHISFRGYSGADDSKPSIIIANNTFYGGGVNEEFDGSTQVHCGLIHYYKTGTNAYHARNVIIENNVFIDAPGVPSAAFLFEPGSTTTMVDTLTMRNNFTNEDQHFYHKIWAETPLVDEDDINVFVGNSDAADVPAYGSTTMGLADPANEDFTIDSSPGWLIDAGIDTNAPADDIIGVTRPQGAADDIGAYEYNLYIYDFLPVSAGTDVGINADLTWSNPPGAVTVDIHFDDQTDGGCDLSVAVLSNQADTETYDPSTLDTDNVYCWRVDVDHAEGTETGVVYTFTTSEGPPITSIVGTIIYAPGAGPIEYSSDGMTIK